MIQVVQVIDGFDGDEINVQIVGSDDAYPAHDSAHATRAKAEQRAKGSRQANRLRMGNQLLMTKYRTVDTRTVAGIEEAERLKASGWTIYWSGLFLIKFYRRTLP